MTFTCEISKEYLGTDHWFQVASWYSSLNLNKLNIPILITDSTSLLIIHGDVTKNMRTVGNDELVLSIKATTSFCNKRNCPFLVIQRSTKCLSSLPGHIEELIVKVRSEEKSFNSRRGETELRIGQHQNHEIDKPIKYHLEQLKSWKLIPEY